MKLMGIQLNLWKKKMSIYDIIYLKKRCPYCHKVSKMEFQTKDGHSLLHTFKIRDKFQDGQFRRIDAIGTCESFECRRESAKESIWTNGYYGGFSRSFDAYIYCDSKGKITNKIKIYKLNYHKGIMEGKLGELKDKDDNMKVVKYAGFNKKGKWAEAKLKPMTTDGWLDKFREDNEKIGYERILYLYNLNDGKEAFNTWFIFRYKLDRIIKILKEQLKIKKDEEFASVFLSNKIEDIHNLFMNGEKNVR